MAIFKVLAYLSLIVLTLTPFFRRLALSGGGEYIGLLSDAGVGLILLVLLVWSAGSGTPLLSAPDVSWDVPAPEPVAAPAATSVPTVH